MKTVLTTMLIVFACSCFTPGKPVSSHTLASRGKMPERFLVQILHCLVSSGILHSVKGVSGGYFLARGIERITLLNLLDSLDTADRPLIPKVDGLAPELHERLTNAMEQIWEAARTELSRYTIADVAGSHNGLCASRH